MPLSWPLTPGRRRPPPAAPTLVDRYWHATPRPIYCGLFLLPLVLIYEIGIRLATAGEWPPRTLVAQRLMENLFGWFGASGRLLPAAALILTIVIWQFAVRGRWRARPWIVGVMLLESVVLAAPLLVLRELLLSATPERATTTVELLLGLGAGVYEELVFRFYLIALLCGAVIGLARVPARSAAPLILLADALIFAACHYAPVGAEPWAWSSFVVRTLGGGYLALVYLGRGLGIAAGCHAAHNLFSALL